jgi:hypothetical protein
MGENNDSDVLQEGNNNKGGGPSLIWGTRQRGDENYSSTKSIGNNNNAGTSQEGDENNAYIDQEGDGNVVNGVISVLDKLGMSMMHQFNKSVMRILQLLFKQVMTINF